MKDEELAQVLVILDRVRDVLLEVGFKHPSVAYKRKRLEKIENPAGLLKYLEILERRINAWKTCPLFPGVKHIDDYAIVGLKGTKEQVEWERRRRDIIEFWKFRPDALRRANKVKS